jgi:phospholipid/cholesterol/gamma-HCH transport system substrate-binding protein
VKNRQYNFLPIGLNPIVGATARPNEITYSENRLRPDYVPPQGTSAAQQPPDTLPAPLPAEAPTADPAIPPTAQPTDPSQGLQGMMTPPPAGQP